MVSPSDLTRKSEPSDVRDVFRTASSASLLSSAGDEQSSAAVSAEDFFWDGTWADVEAADPLWRADFVAYDCDQIDLSDVVFEETDLSCDEASVCC